MSGRTNRLRLSLKELEPKPEKPKKPEQVEAPPETQNDDSPITIGDLIGESIRNHF
jgi:hypothetical protein